MEYTELSEAEAYAHDEECDHRMDMLEIAWQEALYPGTEKEGEKNDNS